MIRPKRAVGIVATALSLAAVLSVIITMGARTTFGLLVYGLLLAGVQALVPCLLFFAGVKVLLRRLAKRRRRVQTLPYHLLIALTLALVMLAGMNLFDWLDSPRRFQSKGWANVWDYELYLVFVPLVILLDYGCRRLENRRHDAPVGGNA